MRFNGKTNLYIVLGFILTVGLGCNKFQLKDYVETPEPPQRTVITKDVLTERLTKRLVKQAKIVTADKLSPLTLQLRFADRNNNFLLNRERFEYFGALANLLRQISRDREANGVFRGYTNEIYKTITLSAQQNFIDEYNAKNITVEDFEKLVDDLRNEGFDQIEFDTNEENQKL